MVFGSIGIDGSGWRYCICGEGAPVTLLSSLGKLIEAGGRPLMLPATSTRETNASFHCSVLFRNSFLLGSVVKSGSSSYTAVPTGGSYSAVQWSKRGRLKDTLERLLLLDVRAA